MLRVTTDENLPRMRQLQKTFYELFREHRRNAGKGPVEFEGAPTLNAIHVQNGRLYSNRREMLSKLAPQQAICAEVGVLRGDLSQFILNSLQPRHLHLFDIDFETYKVTERFRDEIQSNKVCLVEGDSSTKLGEYPKPFFDWIYVDGDHSFEGCWKDLVASMNVLRPDGLIFANDYIFWSHPECRPYGVVQGVNRLCVEYGFEIVGFALHEGMFCDVALTRRP
jgi:hypothetical protein